MQPPAVAPGSRTRRTGVTRRAWLAGAAALCLAGPARGGERLRILVEGAYPPFNSIAADGSVVGFDADIARALCAVLEAECAFVVVPWAGIIGALLEDRGDVIIASMSITSERKAAVAFTDPYYRTPIQFIAPAGFDRPLTREGLAGLRIGVARSTTAETYLRETLTPTVEIVPLESQTEVERGLLAGNVDLAVADSFVLWSFLRSADGARFRAVGGPIHVDEGIGIALRKEDEALRQKLNLALARIRLDGTYRQINARYFPFSIY